MHSVLDRKSQLGTQSGDISIGKRWEMSRATAPTLMCRGQRMVNDAGPSGPCWPPLAPVDPTVTRRPPLAPADPTVTRRPPQALLTLYASFCFSSLASVTGSCLPGLFTSTLSQASPPCWPVCLSTPTPLLCSTLTFPAHPAAFSSVRLP